MWFEVPRIAALLATLNSHSHAVINPVVDLGYANYQGVANATNGVTQWLGMRYAAAPLGNLRFAAPQDPPTVRGTQDASKHAPYCLGVGDRPPTNAGSSEDCLFLDVYTPTNATTTSALPVFVFIQGGGFASNANANFNGRGLVAASAHNIVVVTFNYRVGPYGFISGSQISSPNNGLKDQRKVLQWVQQHITKFGGDPKHVTIGGDSAGAASVTLHLTAYGGRNDSLFHAAAAESQSFATVLNVSQSQYLYNDLVGKTGCSSSKDTLACLRKLSSDQIQSNTRVVPFPGASGPPLYSWQPVIDDDFIRDSTYSAFANGKFLHVPTIFGDDTNGGTIFAPRNTTSLAESNTFLHDQFPALTQTQLDTLDKLYPNPNLVFPNSGVYWRQLSNVYGEMRYMCPGLYLSSAYSNRSVPAWNYRYNVQDPAQVKSGLGVPHTVEVNAIFGPGNTGNAQAPASYWPGQSNAQIVPVIQAYWTSFIRTYNPNTHRLSGTASWDNWASNKMQRFLFDTPVSNSKMETIDAGLKTRCEYLWSIGVAVQQ